MFNDLNKTYNLMLWAFTLFGLLVTFFKELTFIMETMPFSISIVTYMELVQGMHDKRELAKMKKAFAEMRVEIIPLSEDISLRASDYVEMYALSHSMELADALIAGTCMERDETLVTANDKHYRVVEGLQMTIFRP